MLDWEAFTARLRMHAHAKARVSSPVSIRPRYLQTSTPQAPAPSSSSLSVLSEELWHFVFQSPLKLLNFHKDMEEDQTLQLHFITFYKTDRFFFGGR